MKVGQLSNEPPDKRETEVAQKFLAEIADMLEEGRYDWAMDTLMGISDTVSTTNRVSEGQRRAVENIKQSRQGRR